MDKLSAGAQRSVALYLDDARRETLDRFYAPFIRPGDLVFDVGAHVGDRTAAFRRLGARVVAVEPQPELAALLRRTYAGDDLVTIVDAAAGEAPGFAELHVNADNPTVSTLSSAFVAAAAGAEGWESQRWNEAQTVRVTTLDVLIETHGVPAFIKIDVEGFELACLSGLSRRVDALSFEFTTIQRGLALECLALLESRGRIACRASLGESFRYEQDAPVDARTMRDWILELPQQANSGDIYVWSVR